MRRAVIVSCCVSILAPLGTGLPWISQARAETQFNLNPPISAAVNWTTDGVWDQLGFPNGAMHVANLSVPLASSLSVSLPNGDVTLAGLKIGGTTSAVTTNVVEANVPAIPNSRLIFQNDDNSLNAGIPLITSGGVAGSTNVISANMRLNEQLDFSAASTSDITVSGWTYAEGAAPSIRSFMPSGLTAKIERLDISDPANPGNYRQFRLNDSAGSPAGMPTISTQGTLELGQITGYGEIRIGVTASQHPVPLGTVVLRGDNSMAGYIQLNRANVVLAHDNSLGLYGIFGGQPNQGVGMNLISNDDARTESAIAEISQWFTIKGEHSLTWNGLVVQSNSRGWINLLPAGKTFTLAGEVYAVADEDTERTFTFDGTGRTVVTGGLHDKFVFGQGESLDGTGSYRKTGTGSVFVTGSVSTYHGTTMVEAGTLRFNNASHLTDSSAIVSTGGAIGVDTGIFSNPNVLAKFDAADTGGVMLSLAEASAILDFTTGDLATAPNVSIAAPEAGITYTGQIIPAGPNYRLGGGTGKLTLPNANQLTGDRGLVVINGGEVYLGEANNFSGPTTVSDYAFNSRTNQAIADTTSGISTSLFAPTTLAVSSLASLGTASNDASQLLIQGSTLRIQNSFQDTQRLFTIGTRGATIETPKGARVGFINTAPLGVVAGGPALTRTLTLRAEGGSNAMYPIIQDAPDGGLVGVVKAGPGTWELYGDNTYNGPTRVVAGSLRIFGVQTGTGETIVEPDGALGGIGSIGGDLTVFGRIQPGQFTGSLRVGGNAVFAPSSEMHIVLGGTAPQEFSRLELGGAADVAGRLLVALTSDSEGGRYFPKLGDSYLFLSAALGVSGTFDIAGLSGLPAGLTWQLNQHPTGMSLDVVAIPEPSCLALFAVAAACLVSIRRR
jgi:autotransporter-associated beta strand protein